MAHSFKKNAAGGYSTASSEKTDKRIWHKRLRTIELQNLNIINENEEINIPIVHEVSDTWAMNKDGKHIYFTQDSIRKEINGFISGLMNSLDRELYFKNKNHWIVKEFFKYFKIIKFDNKIFTITDKQKKIYNIFYEETYKKIIFKNFKMCLQNNYLRNN
jgi:hypothetical protein